MSALGDGKSSKFKFLDLDLMHSGFGYLNVSHIIDSVTLFKQMEWKKTGAFNISGAELNRLINLMRMAGFTYFEPFVHKYVVRLLVRLEKVIVSYHEKGFYDAECSGPHVEVEVDPEFETLLPPYQYSFADWGLKQSYPPVIYSAAKDSLVLSDCWESPVYFIPHPVAAQHDPTEMQGTVVLDTLVRLIPDLQRYVAYPCNCSVANFSSLTLTNVQSCPGTRGDSWMRLQETIIRLNDVCGWSRERVADWVESLPFDLTFPTPEEQQFQLT